MKVKHAPTPTHSHTGTLPIHNVTRLFSMVKGTEATPPFSETGGKDRGHASFLWDWQKRYRGHASFHWDWNESLILSELFCCRCLCFACLFICVWSLVAVQFLTFTSDWPISGRNAWKAIKPRQIVETIWQPTSVTSTSHTHTVQDGRGERERAHSQISFFTLAQTCESVTSAEIKERTEKFWWKIRFKFLKKCFTNYFINGIKKHERRGQRERKGCKEWWMKEWIDARKRMKSVCESCK